MVDALRVGESILKLGAFLAAAGYLSLRSHFNTLGISSLTYLGFERYVLESYVFLMGVAGIAFRFALPLLAALAVVRLVARFRPLRVSFTSAVPVFALLSVLGILLGAFFLHGPLTDRVVGRLEFEPVTSAKAWLLDAVLAALIVAGPLAYAAHRHRTEGKPVHSAWKAVSALVLALLVTLPILHGEFARPTHYPLVQFKIGSAASQCALVLYEMEAELVVWEASEKHGRIRRLKRQELQELNIGPLQNILKLAHDASQNSSRYPTCVELGNSSAMPSS